MSEDLIRKSGERCILKAGAVPPLYQGAILLYATGNILGRRRKAEIWSQENCLTNNRRKKL